MKRLAIVTTIAALAAGGLLTAQTPAVTAIKAARLFDGKIDTIVADAVVIVEGSRIRAAGSRVPIPPGAQVVDLGDATILPGFIDAHVHVTDESSDDWNADTVSSIRR